MANDGEQGEAKPMGDTVDLLIHTVQLTSYQQQFMFPFTHVQTKLVNQENNNVAINNITKEINISDC